jgi:hypothetical protein
VNRNRLIERPVGTAPVRPPVTPDPHAAVLDVERLGDHVPSGGEGMDGYGYVSCSCGWGDWEKPTWVEHLRAALDLTEGVSSRQHG